MVTARRTRRTVSVEAGSQSFADRLAAHINDKYSGDDGPKANRLSGRHASRVTDYVSSQNPIMDWAIGHPGFPVGRMTLIAGKESSGKTTTCWHVLAETQRRGGVAILIDAESALDEDRAQTIGIDPSTLLVLEPDTLDETISMIIELLNEIPRKTEDDPGQLVTIVWDSVAGLPTDAENELKQGEYAQPGAAAKMLSSMMRKMMRKVALRNVCLIIVNQYREKIAMRAVFSDPNTMIAEHPLRYHASVFFDVAQKSKEVDKTGEPTHIICVAKNKKNKIAKPFRTGEYILRFDIGIDMFDGLLELALHYDLVAQKGAWYQYGESKFQRRNWGKFICDHPELHSAIIEAMGYNYPSDSKMMSIFSERKEDPDEVEQED